MLTPRDTALLTDCFHSVQLSTSQIHQRHFAGKALPTIINRLTRLVEGGWVELYRLNPAAQRQGVWRWGSIYTPTQKAITLLENGGVIKPIHERPLPICPGSLEHDLTLTEVMGALHCRYPDHALLNGRYWQRSKDQNVQSSDAVMTSPCGKEVTAIEVELTPKSERRYHQIVTAYRLDGRVKKVLYVVARESIAAKMKAVITGVKVPLAGLELPTGKFEFVTLRDIGCHIHQLNSERKDAHDLPKQMGHEANGAGYVVIADLPNHPLCGSTSGSKGLQV